MSLINPRLCHLWCVCVFSIAKASSFSLGSLVDTGDIHGGGLYMILSRLKYWSVQFGHLPIDSLFQSDHVDFSSLS